MPLLLSLFKTDFGIRKGFLYILYIVPLHELIFLKNLKHTWEGRRSDNITVISVVHIYFP